MKCFQVLLLFIKLIFLSAQIRLPCFNSSQIAEVVHESDIIFTGKLLELVPVAISEFDIASQSTPREPSSNAYYYYNNRKKRQIQTAKGKRTPTIERWIAKIKIKTIFKGKQNREKEFESEVVEVVIGDGKIMGGCPVRRLRVLDTRVFFYAVKFEFKETPLSKNWIQTLMPLPPTLAILSNVRQSLKDELCAEKECANGSFCVNEGGVGICRCEESCSDIYSPVCGSNDVTFRNECFLKQFVCKHQADINIKYGGECETLDPCKEKVCPHGGKCVAVSREDSICEYSKCDSTDDSTSIICGSDGKQYKSPCQLERVVCQTGKSICVKYLGKCDPCMNLHCPSPAVCQIIDNGEASCECEFECSTDVNHVCGSDGKTYTSECEMKREACQINQELRIIYNGECASGINPCDYIVCTVFQSCVINHYGVAECICPSGCQPVLELVCGSDGVTYDSECQLASRACALGKNITVDYSGSCELCENVQCKFGARCEAGVCVCPRTCPTTIDPVCGSNSVTYNNECELQKYSCVFDRNLRVNYYGRCAEPISTAVPFNMETEVHNSMSSKRNCSLRCHRLGSYLCYTENDVCFCRPGVGGHECDRCLHGFWGLHRIDVTGHGGCQTCSCSELGSVRDDCDQMTGACDCKEGISGYKCDTCSNGNIFTELGCISSGKILAGVEHIEPRDEAGSFKNRDAPVGMAGGIKSARHLQQIPQAHKQIHATFQVRSYLGESCSISIECVPSNTVCLNGYCACADGFYEDSDRIQCNLINAHLKDPDSCSRVSCEPSSTCFDFRNGSYVCACSLGESNANGLGCAKTEIPLPFFDGSASIGLGKLGGNHKLSIEIQITPVFSFAHGILIYGAEIQTRKFISLALRDGFVEFRFDLGSGQAILKSNTRLEGGASYKIVAKRYNRDGLLRVEEEEIKSSSPRSMKSINLSHGGFLGGVPTNSSKVWESAGTSAGFIGCVHKLAIGRRLVYFEDGNDSTLDSFQGILQCFQKGPLTSLLYEKPLTLSVIQNRCISSPCQNNAECWNDNAHGFKCVCHPQFSGKLCETGPGGLRETGATVDFRGFSYLELPKIGNGAREIEIEIWFYPRSGNGLLLYTGQEYGKGDFLTLIINNSFLSFLFDLGSGSANITWGDQLALHRWHWVVATRVGRQGTLQVDGLDPVTGKSPPTLSELNLELPLFVGGVPDDDIFIRGIRIPEPFDGTLQYISINRETHTRKIQDGLEERRLQRYEGPPCGSSVYFPCYNGGSCFPRLDKFICVCPSQFTGLNCQIRKLNAGPIRFGGDTFFKFPRKAITRNKVQQKNEIQILFKTSSRLPAVLLWLGRSKDEDRKSRRGYLGLFVVDGFPELRVNLGSQRHKKPIVLRSKIRVSDGRWHQVLVFRKRRLLVFQVDGASPQRATAPIGSNVLMSDGQIWIGGVHDILLPSEIPPAYHSGFRGCVDVLKVEKRRLPIGKMALAKGLSSCEKDENFD